MAQATNERARDRRNRLSVAPGHRRPSDGQRHTAVGVHIRIATCYNLLMQEARSRVGNRWKLTLPQFDVLAELTRADSRGFTFVELSRLLLVTSGNLTGIVDRLEARQLVRREPDGKDRRVVRVRLTKKGREMTRRMLPGHAEDLHHILSFMPIPSLMRLSSLLDRVRHGLVNRGNGLRASQGR